MGAQSLVVFIAATHQVKHSNQNKPTQTLNFSVWVALCFLRALKKQPFLWLASSIVPRVTYLWLKRKFYIPERTFLKPVFNHRFIWMHWWDWACVEIHLFFTRPRCHNEITMFNLMFPIFFFKCSFKQTYQSSTTMSTEVKLNLNVNIGRWNGTSRLHISYSWKKYPRATLFITVWPKQMTTWDNKKQKLKKVKVVNARWGLYSAWNN